MAEQAWEVLPLLLCVSLCLLAPQLPAQAEDVAQAVHQRKLDGAKEEQRGLHVC